MRHKNKRGARGSTESTDLDQTNAKRFQEESNVVVTEDSEEVEEGIEDNEELNLFINAVNSFHLALKYTWEISENSLAFLDILPGNPLFRKIGQTWKSWDLPRL